MVAIWVKGYLKEINLEIRNHKVRAWSSSDAKYRDKV